MNSTKPRPVSMMIPRNNTFGPTDEPAKAAEAPEPRATLTHQGSTFEVANRPRITRALTPGPALPKPDSAQEIYAKAPYADAPKVKAKVFNFGDPLFTEAHKKQIGAFRDECIRLHAYNVHLKAKLASAADRTESTEAANRELKNDLMALKMQNTQLRLDCYSAIADLKQANDSLAEVESMFAHLRSRPGRRHSAERRAPEGDDDRGYYIDVPERPKSPTPNGGRSP